MGSELHGLMKRTQAVFGIADPISAADDDFKLAAYLLDRTEGPNRCKAFSHTIHTIP